MKSSFLITITFVFFFAGQGCKNDKPTVETPLPPVVQRNIPIPRFDREAAYNYIAKQVEFGPRVPNTEAHKATKNWLSNELKNHGATVIEQDFTVKAYTGTEFNSTNIIGQFHPAAKRRIFLAAHWDSRFISDNDPDESKRNLPVDAADDGASGVGVLLEIAKHLNGLPDDMGVDIIFFDAEDNGISGSEAPKDAYTWGLGSQHWAKNLHIAGYKPMYGILLDMVGAKDARFPKEGYSVQNARKIVDKVWKLAQEMGHGNYFSSEIAGGITDDHRMVMEFARIPMIDIINLPNNTGQTFVKHWHTTNDNMENIDKRTIGAVGQVVLAVIFNEAMGKL